MSEPAADRKGPGLAGVTPAHRAAWESGAASYQSIAEELGIRKQSLAAYAKRNGWTRQVKAAPSASSSSPASQPARPMAEDPEVAAERTHYSLVQAQRILLVRCLEKIQLNPDVIACQRIQATLRGVREELTALGFLPTLNDLEVPTELVIRVMTPEEEAAVQRRAEGDSSDGDGDDTNVVPFTRGRPARSEDALPATRGAQEPEAPEVIAAGAGNSSGQGRTGKSRNRAGNSDGGSEGAPPSSWKLPAEVSLPAADDFRDWLYKFAARHGDVSLRELAGALGGDAMAHGERGNRDYLIAQVLKLTRADPQAMKPLLPANAA